jgi:hypothetical protein
VVASQPDQGPPTRPSSTISGGDRPTTDPPLDRSSEEAADRDPARIAADDEVVRRIRRHRRPWDKVFLDNIRETGTVRAAAEAAGVDRTTPYIKRKRDPAFAAAWAAAEEDAVDLLVEEGRRRALETSDQLLMFFLRAHRPALYGTNVQIRIDEHRLAEEIGKRYGLPVEAVLDEADQLIQKARS